MQTRDRSWISSIAALGSLAAASLCCLPVLPLALAAGGASAAWMTASEFQPVLLGLSALCIGYGFFQARRAKQCSLQRKTVNYALLVVAAGMTAGAILFPQALANMLVGSSSETASHRSSYMQLGKASQFVAAFNQAPAGATILVAFYSPT